MRVKLIVLAVACVAVGAPTGGAATKQRCGTAVLKDWSDGKLSRPYPVRCYQDALNRMPEDMRSYTTAPDDIQRALLARLRAGRAHHIAPTRHLQKTAAPAARRTRRGLEREALAASGIDAASSATRMPIPLVVLGVVGLLLVLAGTAGVVRLRLRGGVARGGTPVT